MFYLLCAENKVNINIVQLYSLSELDSFKRLEYGKKKEKLRKYITIDSIV